MAPVNRLDALRASVASIPHRDHEPSEDEACELGGFEEELRRLSAVNQELIHQFHADDRPASAATEESPSPAADELADLHLENAQLRARIQELEALSSGQADELWLDRQREYEMLLEEKSEVIRTLHQKIQELQESAIGSESASANNVGASGARLGQAEEILRLKRELEEQRRQLEQDEDDMMAQLRQMEMTMAKERAEMARQRQEVQRQQAELTREIENSSRDPELRDRLQSLRRTPEPKQAPAPVAVKPVPSKDQQSSGLLRRLFG